MVWGVLGWFGVFPRTDEGQSSGTGFYTQRPDLEGKSPLRDLDLDLKAEEEELVGLRRQLEAAREEEALLRRRSAADELRRQIAAQQESNARLRGRTKSDTFQSESMRNLSHSQDKDKTLGDEQINIDTLRKSKNLRKLVKKDLKKLNLIDEALLR